MKWLFSTLIALLFVLVVALFAYYDPGYVLVQWRDWIVESSLALVVAVLLGAVILFYLVLRLGGHLLRLPRRLRDWRRRHAARRAQAALVRGYLDLYTGRYPRAEQRLSRYAGYGDTVAVLNYLGRRAPLRPRAPTNGATATWNSPGKAPRRRSRRRRLPGRSCCSTGVSTARPWPICPGCARGTRRTW